MRKAANKYIDRTISWRITAISAFLLFQIAGLHSQIGRSEIQIDSKDQLTITAEIFIKSDTLPFLILLHEQGSSKGEFTGIIHRFQKMNFNCLTPDLRNGGNSNQLSNETKTRALIEDRDMSSEYVMADINAITEYAYNQSGKKVVILGAGANGSLALLAAQENQRVKAVVALSPGEFFRNEFLIEEELNSLQRPLLIACNKSERPYVEQMMSNIQTENKTIYASDLNINHRGTELLNPDHKSSLEYWLTLLMFFKDLQ